MSDVSAQQHIEPLQGGKNPRLNNRRIHNLDAPVRLFLVENLFVSAPPPHRDSILFGSGLIKSVHGNHHVVFNEKQQFLRISH